MQVMCARMSIWHSWSSGPVEVTSSNWNRWLSTQIRKTPACMHGDERKYVFVYVFYLHSLLPL